MAFYFSKQNVLYIVTVLILAVILLWSQVSAYKTGKASAQADIVIGNTKTFMQSFEYFYSDQNRYPSAVEFANLGIMNIYTNGLPVREFSNGPCPNSFSYKRINESTFQLNFCLPGGSQGFSSGWHQAQKTH